jgi:hypothetical protein
MAWRVLRFRVQKLTLYKDGSYEYIKQEVLEINIPPAFLTLFNINLNNSLQNYDISRNFRVIHRVVERLSQLKVSNFCTIAIFESFVKQNIDSNKTCRNTQELLLFISIKYNGS